MLNELKNSVLEANNLLTKYGLVILTWGNVSAIDRNAGLVVIKPSGVPYEFMTANKMVVTDLDGNVVEGNLRPSSDLKTHLELYRAFPGIGSVAHTHSKSATAFAQAECPLPCYGTTHADYFFGEIPCTRPLTQNEIRGDYETATGLVIVEAFKRSNLDPLSVPAVLVGKHGPFTWGESPIKAVENSLVLEQCAAMAIAAELLNPNIAPADNPLLEKHYYRKHGANSYYGQKY